MLYRILINYFRLKLLRLVFTRIMGHRLVKNRNIKTISLISYGLEILTAFLLKGKGKTAK